MPLLHGPDLHGSKGTKLGGLFGFCVVKSSNKSEFGVVVACDSPSRIRRKNKAAIVAVLFTNQFCFIFAHVTAPFLGIVRGHRGIMYKELNTRFISILICLEVKVRPYN